MLTLFKKIFGKSGAKTASPLAPSASTPSPAQMQFESAIQMAKVEVARLSLKAIVAKFPEDIRGLLNTAPADDATVALPIQTIIKQLSAGVVRMSLASLHRQAPAGLFKPLPAGDKRMVEVPLVEVFKHVKPTAFKRRGDQRHLGPVDEEFEAPVFNSRVETKPVQRAAQPAPAEEPTAGPEPEPAPAAMRVVAPPIDLNLAGAKAEAKPSAQPTAKESAAKNEPTLVLPLAKLSEGWAEEIRVVLADLDAETKVAVPHTHIAPGLARGKIACTWKQLGAWLTPAAPASIAIDPETSLLLPLKVIAPAFLAAGKSAPTQRKSVAVDETIPALFSGNKPAQPQPTPASTAHSPAPQTQHKETKAKADEPPVAEAKPAAAEAVLELEIDEPVEEPAPSSTAPEPVLEVKIESTAQEHKAAQSAPVAESKSVAVSEEPASASAEPTPPVAVPTIGDTLGEPGRTNWTPASLVQAVVKLPGVAGAVVALQEGFQVAHALPEGVSAETVSAFLPQIFTRLNQYAGEMKLGDVDDLLFTTRGAHCMIYRLGAIYFAVLGKPGESLPWSALRLVADELSREVTK